MKHNSACHPIKKWSACFLAASITFSSVPANAFAEPLLLEGTASKLPSSDEETVPKPVTPSEASAARPENKYTRETPSQAQPESSRKESDQQENASASSKTDAAESRKETPSEAHLREDGQTIVSWQFAENPQGLPLTQKDGKPAVELAMAESLPDFEELTEYLPREILAVTAKQENDPDVDIFELSEMDADALSIPISGWSCDEYPANTEKTLYEFAAITVGDYEFDQEPVLMVSVETPAIALLANNTINLASGEAVISQNGSYTISGTYREQSGRTTQHVITVEENVQAQLTLDSVVIDAPGAIHQDSSCIELKSGADVTLILSGTSSLSASSNNSAAIHVPPSARLTIQSASGSDSDMLLAAAYHFGAGIGGKSGEGCGTITFKSGAVMSVSGGRITDSGFTPLADTYSGAGIGGGSESTGSKTITINGGNIYAAASVGAGIGGGSGSTSGEILIAGGEIQAQGGVKRSTSDTVAMGPGSNAGSGKNSFTLQGSATEAATANLLGDSPSTVTVNPGTEQLINAPGTRVKIRYGEEAVDKKLLVTPETGVTYLGNGRVVLAGSGPYTVTQANPGTAVSQFLIIESDCTVTLEDVNIYPGSSVSGVPAIEVKRGLSSVTLNFEGDNTLTGSQLASAIANHGTPLIIGGSGRLTAIAGSASAAIGGTYSDPDGNHITIKSGTLTLKGSSDASCLGAGAGGRSNPGTSDDLHIEGGLVSLIQENWGYCLGASGDVYGATPSISITGGTVTATHTETASGDAMGKICSTPITITPPSGQSGLVYTGSSAPGTLAKGFGQSGTYSCGTENYMQVRFSSPHSLTITDGTAGSATTDLTAGDAVLITATDKSADNLLFGKWTLVSGAGRFADENASSTTFYIGDSDTAIQADYVQGYKLTVNNGSGGGLYKEGEAVSITAAIPSWAAFSSWKIVSGDGTFENANSASTRFIVKTADTVIQAQYTDTRNTGDFVVTGGSFDTDYTFENGCLSFIGSGSYQISMKEGITETGNSITIKSGMPTITLNSVKINSSLAFSISAGVNASLTLAGENSLYSTNGSGLLLQSGSSLSITSSQGDGKIEGSLQAESSRTSGDTGYGGAGIETRSGSTLIIRGGTIHAHSGMGSAGIGAAYRRSGGNVIIEGGMVTASSLWGGAGIGGGYQSRTDVPNSITISGGIVKANGGQGSAGIGCGYQSNAKSIITITGGSIGAKGASWYGGERQTCGIGLGAVGGSVQFSISESALITERRFESSEPAIVSAADLNSGAKTPNLWINITFPDDQTELPSPVLKWPAALNSIYYGQKLSQAGLTEDGLASMEGSFRYEDCEPLVGTNEYRMYFVPKDTLYNAVSAPVTVTVLPAAAQISTLPQASDLTVGQALKQAVISGGTAVNPYNSSKTVEGSWRWLNPETVPAETGFQTALFVPDDTVNYNGAVQVSLEVAVKEEEKPEPEEPEKPNPGGTEKPGTGEPEKPGSTEPGQTKPGTSDPSKPGKTDPSAPGNQPDSDSDSDDDDDTDISANHSATGSGSTGSSSGNSGTATLPPQSTTRYRWEWTGSVWYAYDHTGQRRRGFIYDAAYKGYFYLDENAVMVTGWVFINGSWYYFHTVSDGTKGIMLRNCKTPDGYFVGPDGKWDGKPSDQRLF